MHQQLYWMCDDGGNLHFYQKDTIKNVGSKMSIAKSNSLISFKEPRNIDDELLAINVTPIFGLIGIFKLNMASLVVVLNDAKKHCELGPHNIYVINEIKIYECHLGRNMSESELKVVEECKKLIYGHFERYKDYMYFSYSYNLHISLQQQNLLIKHPSNNLHFKEAYGDLFVWNSTCISSVKNPILKENFCIRLIFGFIGHFDIDLLSTNFKVVLISRRSYKQAGTRYFKRGADEHGNVANFVETEQMVLFEDKIYSYLQIRGSIPFKWTQYPNLKYNPPFVILPSYTEDEIRFDHHFKIINSMYGNCICLNLAKTTRSEGILSAKYQKLMEKMNKNFSLNKYISFDFHSQCKGLNWSALNKLVDNLTPDLKNHGYFLNTGNHSDILPSVFKSLDPLSTSYNLESTEKVLTSADDKHKLSTYNSFHSISKPDFPLKDTQSGVIRTNCIDCLDRTNVVQSKIAFTTLIKQINQYLLSKETDQPVVIQDDEKIKSYNGNHFGIYELSKKHIDDISYKFNNLWADNGDACSIQYSGTGALKSDFTRTGERTITGLINDGFHSVTRYILNNFYDGTRQDEFNMMNGTHTAYIENFIQPKPYSFLHSLVPIFLISSILFFSVNTISFKTEATTLGFSIAFASIIYFSLKIMKKGYYYYISLPSNL